ncbi:hypothetical protein PVL29_016107 [Vitis rotundifolia]|uniref:Protein kinase domain-containing protein n=1 Tax=Vitis rotundifolia TaxID=103349 RepID=A0AA39DMJ9_VITRO|nr:hypothetical protein PVL29_016107 [Vitis rotundifolia]
MEHMITKGVLVGVGSSGKVHMAFSNGRLLALKSSCSSCYSSLQKEEEILQRLGHCPDIVDCFGGYSTQEGNGVLVYNLVLEYAPVGSLESLMIRRKSGLMESEVQRFTRMIVRGLRDVHKEGFVHCDLKVDNILVFHSEDGGHKVKIADFGQAKRSEREEFKNEAPKDIWSLGCMVVEMFTGKPAWLNCKDVNELAVRIVSWRQVPKVLENISEHAKDFLRRCLEKDPTERWTAERLLSHPFISQVPASEVPASQ